jgi:uncharacterized protein YjaG (DUF416 family)
MSILKKLSFQKQLAFAYLSCERVYPNYQYFVEKFNFGDHAILRMAIEYVRESLFNTINQQRVETFYTRLMLMLRVQMILLLFMLP